MRLYQKPSGLWAVDYVTDQGERRRVSTGKRDKAAARQRAREIVMGIGAAPNVAPLVAATESKPGDLTMRELYRRCELTCWSPSECKSQRTVKSNLKVLEELNGDDRVIDQRYSTLEKLVEQLKARGYAPGTIKRKMDMVSKSLAMAAKWDIIIAKPPMPTFKVDNSRTRVITDAEEVAIFAAVDRRRMAEPTRDWRRIRALLTFLMDTGCRLGESLHARIDWFEVISGDHGEDQWVIRIPGWATKTGKPRAIPLTPRIVTELPRLFEDAVPVNDQHGSARIYPFTPATAWYHWTNIRDDLFATGKWDLSDVVLHTFRHTCLTRLAKRLNDIHLVSEWAGHADIKITAGVYAHLDVTDLMRGVKALTDGGSTSNGGNPAKRDYHHNAANCA